MYSVFQKCSSYFQNKNVLSFVARIATFNEKNLYVVVSKDERTIVCWHPVANPPFEQTKPLPMLEPEINEGDSVLKLQNRRDEKYRFQPDGPTTQELMKLTYTTKHRWFPNVRYKFKDPDPDPDREGI